LNRLLIIAIPLVFAALCLADDSATAPGSSLLFRGATDPGDVDKVLRYEEPSGADAQVKVLSTLADLGGGVSAPDTPIAPEQSEEPHWMRRTFGWFTRVIFLQLVAIVLHRWRQRQRACHAAANSDENPPRRTPILERDLH
jgi:hypothetical protein